jgi:hypothetical protein
MKKLKPPRGIKSMPRSSLYKPTKTVTMKTPRISKHKLGLKRMTRVGRALST